MDIKAAIARTAHGDFSVEPATLEAPREDEVLVRIAGVGLCHTDLVFRDQFMPYPLPSVFGHEGSGTIEVVGAGVEGLAVGDRVVLGFSSCGRCPRCDQGLPSYCREFPPLNFGGGRLDGTTALEAKGERVASHFFGQSSFASHAVTRARNVVKVEDLDVPLEILGPLGCGLQTGAGGVMRSLACPEGSSIAIFGGGPVGLAAVMGAVIQGCKTIVLIEPMVARRTLARDLGATHAIDPTAGDVGEAIRAIVPEGVDFAFESSGRAAVVATALAALGTHGLLGLVGVPPTADAALSVNLASLITFGHRICGIMEGDSDPQTFIPELIAHHHAGRFPFDKLVKTYPLDQINQAVADQAKGECVKAVLLP